MENTSVEDRIRQRLTTVYGEGLADETAAELDILRRSYEGKIPVRPRGWTERDALLITYADSVLGESYPVSMLHTFLKKSLAEQISFVHLLPFFPYSSDDGFAVKDFRAVRPDIGRWGDIQSFSEDYRLVLDGVINHVSASSGYMEEYSAGNPAYDNFFISLDSNTDTSSVLRTRNTPLLHEYETRRGKEWLWTTFSQDQVDLNYANPKVLLEIIDVLLFYAQNGAGMIRLDAIPYMWKKLGTTCAHLPETHELIKLLHDVIQLVAPHVLLLTETNVPHKENISYFGDKGDEAQMIYNFSLAPLILWSLFKGDAGVLSTWAKGIEKISNNATYLNITATHDGIGMRPTEGILSEEERQELVQLAHDHGGDITGKRNSDGSVSVYELNVSYFDAVNDPRADEPLELQVQRFICSQAIPMAMMGIPGIYIHSLLGSRNDLAGVRRTGRVRSINREQLDVDTLCAELADRESLRARIFGEMKRMLSVRGQQPAFHPDAEQEILDSGPKVFALRRTSMNSEQKITALHNVTGEALKVPGAGIDLLTGETFPGGGVPMAPYQVIWLEEAT